jgi:hypothetical protein
VNRNCCRQGREVIASDTDVVRISGVWMEISMALARPGYSQSQQISPTRTHKFFPSRVKWYSIQYSLAKEHSPMFLQRLFAACKSFVSRKPPDDLNVEARIILQRVRELMELTPAAPLVSCHGVEPTTAFEPDVGLVATTSYGERAYAEDSH